jgi:primosomal protein N' (replication factor Y)
MPVNIPQISTQDKLFAKVALPIPVDTHFTYEVPKQLLQKVFVGCRVEVPFGRRTLSGIVIELTNKRDVSKVKPIRMLYDTYLQPRFMELTRWMASYYGCTIGEAAQSVLPPSLKRSKQKSRLRGIVVLNRQEHARRQSGLKRAPRQSALAAALAHAGGSAETGTILHEWGFSTIHVRSLLDKRIVELHPSSVGSPLEAMDRIVLQLNPDQERALEAIESAVETRRFSPMLLHGVTGSGKTEIYIRASKYVLSKSGGCIVLVPEIGLLPQATARYRRVFGDDIAIMHSRLTGAERFEIWNRIEKGECSLVLGPRSAVFSPVRNLRMIIVDEEQDDSYKQEDKPRYHARSVAMMRGKFENLTVLLGSATPSAESLHNSARGKYTCLMLPKRVGGASLPGIEIVDMRQEEEKSIFSSLLVQRLESNLEQGLQSIIFLNKRGHARFVQCGTCGWVARCRNCDISLIYHRVDRRLKCHYCGYARAAICRCDTCRSPKLRFAGVGTQRVELDLSSTFPGLKVLRMDADSTSGKEGHRRVLEKFSTGAYPVLIGTQMVAKGHHFPRVNLVGVLHAEDSLNYPDFRSSERTFHQLLQVSGRAGRMHSEGEVIIQTYMPDHPVFTHLVSHDYDGFMKQELKIREQLNYPPFSRLILASFSSRDEGRLGRIVVRWADEVRSLLRGTPADVLGPAEPLVARVKNQYRQQVLIRGRLTDEQKRAALNAFKAIGAAQRGGAAVDVRWDVDPEMFL